VFTGQLVGAELSAAYASMDVFVHTGEHKTFCQSCRRRSPVACRCWRPIRAVPATWSPRGTGYLRAVRDFEPSLRRAVQALADDDQRRHFGHAARRSVLRRTWPTVCDELLGHYAAARALQISTHEAA